jgi:hypothetical protein
VRGLREDACGPVFATFADQHVPSFGRDLEAVGKILVDRIQREETTLYLPAY